MEICAPAAWHGVDFVSDLHLQAAAPATLAAFASYLQTTPADALFILGDLFEVWVGDDCLDQTDSFAASCANLLRTACSRLAVYVMHGNRDFLMGERLMQTCGAQALADASVLEFGGTRWLLTHGDAQCLDDAPYQQFRSQVRSAQWQHEFLSQPLAQRLEIAHGIRARSEQAKHSGTVYADLDTPACLALLHAHQAQHLIHGHTHKPGAHMLSADHTRYVLSDWDFEASPARADVLRLTRRDTADSCQLTRVRVAA